MAETPEPGTSGLVPPALLARFEERIGEELAERPVEVDTAELRQQAAALLPRLGMVSLYELLGVSVGASAEEVYGAFNGLARHLHPSLAARLSLPETVLRLLFEHAAYAYLTLSDPQRRKDYDRANPATADTTPRGEQELTAVRRDMARKSYRRAQSLMRTEQYHYVVELLRDCVRWDPRPEAFALLGEALAKNPKWRVEAVENMQEAIRLAPREAGYRLRLAQLLEEMERREEAIAEFRAVLEKVPNHPEALAGLARLGAERQPEGKGWFR